MIELNSLNNEKNIETLEKMSNGLLHVGTYIK